MDLQRRYVLAECVRRLEEEEDEEEDLKNTGKMPALLFVIVIRSIDPTVLPLHNRRRGHCEKDLLLG